MFDSSKDSAGQNEDKIPAIVFIAKVKLFVFISFRLAK